MSENALLKKLKVRYAELSDDHPWKSKLKEVIDIIEEEQCGCFNGAYVGSDYWEQERYTDMRLALRARQR